MFSAVFYARTNPPMANEREPLFLKLEGVAILNVNKYAIFTLHEYIKKKRNNNFSVDQMLRINMQKRRPFNLHVITI